MWLAHEFTHVEMILRIVSCFQSQNGLSGNLQTDAFDF